MTSTDRDDFLQSALRLEFSILVQRASESPLVSVVVASLDRRELLRQALEALFRQDLESGRYEVLAIDDGSDDRTDQMLIEMAAKAPCGYRAIRLPTRSGKALSRNLGVALARGELVAFTDSDCLPAEGWLRACVDHMQGRTGIVQGKTLPDPDAPRRLFSHYIVTDRLDGSFSTSNICYRRQAILDAGGLDPRCDYWEDTDLGWRVSADGWDVAFVPEALVYHQVMPLSVAQWLLWPLHFRSMPAKAARHPNFRSHLFLGLWVHWFHALFDLALISAVLGIFLHPGFFTLAIPYAAAFPKQHGLRGRMPPVKAALHLAWDSVSFLTLLASSVRYRAVVL